MVEDILALIPHRPPFVMIGELLFADDLSARTSYCVSRDNLFVENERFNEAGLLENMAQTVAAGAGYMAKKRNEAVRVGFIGAVKNFTVVDLPDAGDELVTETTITDSVFNMVLITGNIRHNDTLIASCEMNIFIGPQS